MEEGGGEVFTALLAGGAPAGLVPEHPDVPPMTGWVSLTMPVSAWLGTSDAPGEVAGSGPVDAGTCRDLARRLGTGPGTLWCLTLTDKNGQAVAHGCARDGPGICGLPG